MKTFKQILLESSTAIINTIDDLMRTSIQIGKEEARPRSSPPGKKKKLNKELGVQREKVMKLMQRGRDRFDKLPTGSINALDDLMRTSIQIGKEKDSGRKKKLNKELAKLKDIILKSIKE